MKKLFQRSDGEEEDSGYASLATVSSIQTDKASVHMADNGNDDLRRRLKAQEQTSKAQQEALNNIQQMLAQLLTNRNNNDIGSNHNEENIMMMSKLRLRSQRKVLSLMLKFLKASKLRSHP